MVRRLTTDFFHILIRVNFHILNTVDFSHFVVTDSFGYCGEILLRKHFHSFMDIWTLLDILWINIDCGNVVLFEREQLLLVVGHQITDNFKFWTTETHLCLH